MNAETLAWFAVSMAPALAASRGKVENRPFWAATWVILVMIAMRNSNPLPF